MRTLGNILRANFSKTKGDDQLLKDLNISHDVGLSEIEATNRRIQFGSNKRNVKEKKSEKYNS